jgi:hypothetical protein
MLQVREYGIFSFSLYICGIKPLLQHKICALITCAITIIASNNLMAQKLTELPLIAFPVGGYTPETRWGIGLAASYHFQINKEDTISPFSQMQLGAVITQNKQQVYSLPFNIYWKQRKHQAYGEITYSNYLYYFFGTQSMPQDDKERYDSKFLRVRLNYLKKVRPNLFIGARWWLNDFKITDYSTEGNLIKGMVPGSQGGTASGPGVIVLLDNRNKVYYTTSGRYLELVYHNQDNIFGSDFNYHRYRFDTRKFIPFSEKSTLGIQLFGDFLQGNVPFFEMTGVGGEKRMRGYLEGRFRDKNLVLLQLEYRYRLSERWAFAAFGSSALIENSISNYSVENTKWTGGAGVRYFFDPKKRMTIRLDAAYNGKTVLPYLSVGEAF